MSEITCKTVTVDTVIDGVHYTGNAVVRTDGIDWAFEPSQELQNCGDLSEYVHYDGYSIATRQAILRAYCYHLAGCTDVAQCEVTGYYVLRRNLVTLEDGTVCHRNVAFFFDVDDQYYLRSDCEEHRYRDSYGECYHKTAPRWWWDERYYCDRCSCYVNPEDWDSEEDSCIFCAENVIDGYCESHDREIIYFGDYKDEDSFAGLGFELEVDCDEDNSRSNNYTAKHLCAASGLRDDEMRFAHDGSLQYGFECISQPHTVKDFWEKSGQWTEMLKYLVNNGYRSHDTDTCGLHVHVSRNMFGRTKEQQDLAIAKVYTFFDENWKDMVKVSRRHNFNYCDKNSLDYEESDKVSRGSTTKLKAWRKSAYKSGCRGHYVALNNANTHTFEYRLGRGTLNAWSFFSWIDLIVTITNNARRITCSKVETNDLVSWLGGIKETTAKYIYKRGAFKSTMLTLYPEIEWELSTDDNHNDSND